MIILRNLTSGAPWAPRFYRLDRNTSASTGARRLVDPSDHIVGIGSRLLTISSGRLVWRLLAIYLDRDEWMVFDGEREIYINEVTATWEAGPSLGGVGLASLKLERANFVETISYVRPWLRHWFENGWSLTDVDIAWVLPQCIDSDDARERLRRSLDVGRNQRAADADVKRT